MLRSQSLDVSLLATLTVELPPGLLEISIVAQLLLTLDTVALVADTADQSYKASQGWYYGKEDD